ncbi:MAG: ATP-binding cassette domain-containing protein [Candidatus Thorarchaeota archaeon]|nr:MAG: ATP-binding cassette domain-containing protein [Candidatus Thorarchaeota archaeon]
MNSVKSIVERMDNDELIRLARQLEVSLTNRKIKRDLLVETIQSELEEHYREGIPWKKTRLKDPAIQISSLTKKFGNTVAVRELNLVVRPGQIVGLVGPNGAGKTTTLRVLAGIIRPTEGSVRVNGFDMNLSPLKAKQRLGYIPERPTCYPNLKVREYLTFIAKIYRVPQIDAALRMREYVDLFQLDELLDAYIGTLSKGNLQRTLLVGIFVRPPPHILALDEPIYGLDPRGAWSLKVLLKKLRDEGSAILISTHILEIAEGLCDRLVIMHEGDVVGKGTLEELLVQTPNAHTIEEIFLELTGGIPET